MKFLSGAAGLLTAVVGFVSATSLFWAGIMFEHRPHGWPNIEVAPRFWPWPFAIHLPDGPFVQLTTLRVAEAAAGKRVAAITVKQTTITDAAAKGEDVAQARIVYRYRVIAGGIPLVVTPAVDRDFPLSVGFVRAHDAAASGLDIGQVPGPAGQSDDSAASVKPSDLAAVLAANYKAAKQDAQQLSDLQQWVRDQQAATNAP